MRTSASSRSSPLLVTAGLALLLWVPAQLWTATSFVPPRSAGRAPEQKVEVQAESRRAAVGVPFAALLAANGIASSEPAEAFPWDNEDQYIYAKIKVALEGDKGGEEEITLRLHPEWAPRGVKRFKQLVSMGQFEDAAVFHVDAKTAHFGLPAEPTLAPDRIKDDIPRASNLRGTLSFSSSGIHTRQDQLFFNIDNNEHLDQRGYVPIGEVVDGMDAVDSLYRGYGRRPDRGQIVTEGNKYLDVEFPKLSKISSVEMM